MDRENSHEEREKSLRVTYDELERRAREWTAELVAANERLRKEMQDREEAEEQISAMNILLGLFSKRPVRKDYFEGVTQLLQSWSGCRCLGIRVLDERGNIPYESSLGFTEEFWKSENWLSLQKDDCVCIRVIRGQPDPQDSPLMTPGGSFRCENLAQFFGGLSEEDTARFRCTCLENGFRSVAVIPIHYREQILGAIHLADEKEGMVSLKTVRLIEAMAPVIGEAAIRFKLEQEIRDSESRLRALSFQLLTIQENERKRIARELHDGLGQMLTSVKFRIETALQEKGRKKSTSKNDPLRPVIPMIQESIEEVRRIQMDLRPSTLDDLGILATLGWFTREFEKIYSTIRIKKKFDIEESEVSVPLKTVIYRVTQEALNNIAKHTKTTLVRLSLMKVKNRIELVIEDNGMGFNLERTLSRESSKKGFGLSSMRERVDLSGGIFLIESAPGKGTVVRATWPLFTPIAPLP